MAAPVNGQNGRRNGLRLPHSLSWGNLITLVGMLIGLAVHYMAMQSDIRALNERLNAIEQLQIARMEQDIRDLRRDYRDLRDRVDKTE